MLQVKTQKNKNENGDCIMHKHQENRNVFCKYPPQREEKLLIPNKKTMFFIELRIRKY